jgi:hypothetical protein
MSLVNIHTEDIVGVAEFHTSKLTLQQSNPEQYQQLFNLLQTTENYTNFDNKVTLYETHEHRHYNHTRTKCIMTIPTPPQQKPITPAAKKRPRSPHSPDYPPPNISLTDVDITTSGNI